MNRHVKQARFLHQTEPAASAAAVERPRPMTRHRIPRLASIAAVAVLAGCGAASTSGTTTESAAVPRVDRAMVQFARCMRAHGIDMPDPVQRPGREGLTIGFPEQVPATTGAYSACGHYLQPAIELKQRASAQRITLAVRLALIHYAECMRGHAVAMLDPNALGQLSLGNVPGIINGFGRYTPQFRAADHACRNLLPASVYDNGTGP
jgi:hypothetical protein